MKDEELGNKPVNKEFRNKRSMDVGKVKKNNSIWNCMTVGCRHYTNSNSG